MKKLPLLALLLGLGLGPALGQRAPKAKVKTKAKVAAPVAAPLPPPQPAEVVDWAARYGDQLTAALLKPHLSVLASDEYEGRETGQPGQKKAADYIGAHFKEFGLTGPVEGGTNPYYQAFQLESSSWAAGAQTLQVGGKSYKWLVDFYALGRSPFQQQTTVQPVFLGYGIDQEGYSDYAGRDVKGKDLLILQGEPTAEGRPVLGADGNSTKWGLNTTAKLVAAAQHGARSVFFVDFSPNVNFPKLVGRLTPSIEHSRVDFAGSTPERAPAFYLSPQAGYQLLKTNEAAVRKYLTAVGAARKPVPAPFKLNPVKVLARQQRSTLNTENVLGLLPGTDRREEILVISAHYDHLGVINKEVYNGADDDGSGTTAVLALAELFARAQREGHGPRRSILFLANVGEEKGLLGSEYYTDHPVFPLDKTIADLNIDMVGRTDPEHEGKDKPDYVYVIGADKLSSELNAIDERMNEKYTQLQLDYRYNSPDDPNRFYYRSDHYNFARHKVPVAFYFNGVHADYHEASDEVSKIEFDKLAKRARLVFHVAWELANRSERIEVDSDKP